MHLENKIIIKVLITFFIALSGGIVFELLKFPIPWLLGPMITTFIGSNLRKHLFYWPIFFCNIGMTIVGYTIDLSLTPIEFYAITLQIPSMLIMTFFLILICLLIAYVISFFLKITLIYYYLKVYLEA